MGFKNLWTAAALAMLPLVADAASIAPPARIVSLEAGSDWTKFRFSPQLHGGAWLEGDVAVASGGRAGVQRDDLRPVVFEFTLRRSAMLQVTDAWLFGDVFDVSWNGRTVRTSGVGTPDLSRQLSGDPAYDIGGDFDAAFLDSRWSSGSWVLGRGSYQVTGQANPSLMDGSGALRVLTLPAVPVPASMVLILSASAAFGAASALRREAR